MAPYVAILAMAALLFALGTLAFSYRHVIVRTLMPRPKAHYVTPPKAVLNAIPAGAGSGWPAAGWVPYQGGPLTVPVGPNPVLSHDSQALVNVLWKGRSDDAGDLQVYSGPPPPPHTDYSADTLYFGKGSDPLYIVSCYEYGGQCRASGVAVHIPKGAYPSGGTDAHLIVRDTATGKDVLLWESPIPNGTGGALSVGWGGAIESNGDGLDAVGSTASGISALYSVRAVDLSNDSINHALLVSINGESSGGFVYPAVGWDKAYFKDNYPKMGAHFWLDVPPSQLPPSCPLYAKSYLTALNKYGAYFADNAAVSGVFGVFAESDLSYTFNGGPSVWGPFMQSLGKNANGMSEIAIDNCGINMQQHMHVLVPPAAPAARSNAHR